MGKKEKDQGALFNLSPSVLILPNGVEFAPGAEVEIPGEYAENEGVKSWIESGMIGARGATVVVSGDDAALRAALDRANAERADAEAKAAEAEAMADDLQQQVAKLTADLEAATKPQ